MTIPVHQAAAIGEALMAGELHPMYEAARALAEGWIEESRVERIREGQRMMQAQIDRMDEDELAAFHRHND